MAERVYIKMWITFVILLLAIRTATVVLSGPESSEGRLGGVVGPVHASGLFMSAYFDAKIVPQKIGDVTL